MMTKKHRNNAAIVMTTDETIPIEKDPKSVAMTLTVKEDDRRNGEDLQTKEMSEKGHLKGGDHLKEEGHLTDATITEEIEVQGGRIEETTDVMTAENEVTLEIDQVTTNVEVAVALKIVVTIETKKMNRIMSGESAISRKIQTKNPSTKRHLTLDFRENSLRTQINSMELSSSTLNHQKRKSQSVDGVFILSKARLHCQRCTFTDKALI
jgi:hypothetical protein